MKQKKLAMVGFLPGRKTRKIKIHPDYAEDYIVALRRREHPVKDSISSAAGVLN